MSHVISVPPTLNGSFYEVFVEPHRIPKLEYVRVLPPYKLMFPGAAPSRLVLYLLPKTSPTVGVIVLLSLGDTFGNRRPHTLYNRCR